MTRVTRKRHYSLFPGQSSGWVARGSVQTLSQMNGCHVPGNRGHTEPGLQANWQKSPSLFPYRTMTGTSAKRLKLRRDKSAAPVKASNRGRVLWCRETALESGASNDSLSLTAYQYLKPVPGAVRPVPIDAHIVPWYPIHMLLRGACSPLKSGNYMVSPGCRVGLGLMMLRLV